MKTRAKILDIGLQLLRLNNTHTYMGTWAYLSFKTFPWRCMEKLWSAESNCL